jgi:hypothetical protein
VISLLTRYPGQSASDPAYALGGKAINVTASGAGNGTPVDKSWMNCLFGWQYALMAAAGLTPNNLEETQTSSQLLDAVRQVAYQKMIGAYFITGGVSKNDTQLFPLTNNFQSGSFVLSADQVQVPEAGKYRVAFTALASASSATNPSQVSASVKMGSTVTTISATAWRYSTTTSLLMLLHAESVVSITTPGSQAIGVVCDGVNGIQFASGLTHSLIIERVG